MEELQGAVIIAQAACPDVRFTLLSETTGLFIFQSETGVELFLRGIAYLPRLSAVVNGTEVIVSYLD